MPRVEQDTAIATVGHLFFLREILLATASLRIGPQ
jgi:hypothetical protein